jgi:SAM-dependent methyltransferase
VHFARALPRLDWQPSEIDPVRRDSITAWSADAGLPNLRPVIELDATAPGWSERLSRFDLILVVNLLHLVSEKEARTLIKEAAKALGPSGRLILYGPFLRDGETTSEGDAQFHASLISADPEIGYKDDFEVIDWLHAEGLDLVDVVEMPANNLSLVATRPF